MATASNESRDGARKRVLATAASHENIIFRLWIFLFPGKTLQKRNSHTMSLIYLHTDSIHGRSNYCSCEKLQNSTTDFLQLEHLFKANVSNSILALYIKTKSTETTVIVMQWSDLLSSKLHWFFTVSTRSNRFDQKISRATLVLLSWCNISLILQSYFDYILIDGRKCCLNVIPAGSFSLSLQHYFLIYLHLTSNLRR